VADWASSRVLRFDNASSKANGANADGVLGQPNFTSHISATNQHSMSYPVGVFVDTGGRLWVTDSIIVVSCVSIAPPPKPMAPMRTACWANPTSPAIPLPPPKRVCLNPLTWP